MDDDSSTRDTQRPEDRVTREALARLDDELARIAEREPGIGAWVVRHRVDTVREALAVAPDGPLRGFTLGVKDIIDTADLPTGRGSGAHAGHRPLSDAACVALARAAGAVVTGKTVTTELALLTPAATRNPWDPTRTPGGSSSGSAAAVATGMVRVALGTQTAGSVIRPAAFCGVVGCKPTYGLVPTSGVYPVAPSLDTVGWFARTVADAAALLDALTIRPADPAATTATRDDGPAPAGGAAPDRPRLGLHLTDERDSLEPAALAALEATAALLREAGFAVEEIEPLDVLAGLGEVAGTIMVAEAAASLAWERLVRPDQLSAGLRRLLARGEAVPLEDYADAQRRAAVARQAFDDLLSRRGLTALLTPPAAGEAPGRETTGDPRFCRIWTLLGVPAVTVPIGPGPSGLPLGAQVVGARWHDRAVLAAAGAVAGVVSADGALPHR